MCAYRLMEKEHSVLFPSWAAQTTHNIIWQDLVDERKKSDQTIKFGLLMLNFFNPMKSVV